MGLIVESYLKQELNPFAALLSKFVGVFLLGALTFEKHMVGSFADVALVRASHCCCDLLSTIKLRFSIK